jgi:hypothetical protein
MIAAAPPSLRVFPPMSDAPVEERTTCYLVERLSATDPGRYVLQVGQIAPYRWPAVDGRQHVALHGLTYVVDGRPVWHWLLAVLPFPPLFLWLLASIERSVPR